MRLLFIQSALSAPPGIVGQLVLERGGRYDVIAPAHGWRSVNAPAGSPIPPTPGDHDGLVVLGGAMDAFDDSGYPWFADLMALIRAFDDAGRPVLGLCLGAQLIARAYGARAYRADQPEYGFAHVTPTHAGSIDPLLAPLGGSFDAAQWHRDTFDLPDRGTLLLTGDTCRNQGFRVGTRVYGFQCHIEANADIMRDWLNQDLEDLRARDPALPQRIDDDMARCLPRQFQAARVIAGGWLDLVADG